MKEEGKSNDDNFAVFRWVIGLAILGSVAGYAFGAKFLVKDAHRVSKNFERQYHNLHPKKQVEEAEEAIESTLKNENLADGVRKSKEAKAASEPTLYKEEKLGEYQQTIASRFPNVNNYVKRRAEEYKHHEQGKGAEKNE